MPSYLHEGVLELFRADPTLAASLLVDVCGMQIPGYVRANSQSCDFSDIGPKEFRGDLAISLNNPDGDPVLGICVEIQLTDKPDKRWSWPVYQTTLRARLRCPVVLLVVVPTERMATWAATPIETGHPGFTLRPMVIGPSAMPLVTDPEEAKSSPERAVLSAMAHGSGPRMDEVLTTFLEGLTKTDQEHANMYFDLVDEVLSSSASRRLEELMTMTREYQGRIARKYVEEGREEGLSKALFTVLKARSLPVSKEQRARIEQCGDAALLDEWLSRAATVRSTEEIFD